MARKILAFGDTHFPFEKQKALQEMFTEAGDIPFDEVIHFGDCNDHYPDSVYVKDPRITPMTWISRVRPGIEKMWYTVHEIWPKAKMTWLEGNHEFRWQQQIWELSNEIRAKLMSKGVPEHEAIENTDAISKITVSSLFPVIKKLNIQYVMGQGSGMVKIGKVHILHGDKSTLSSLSAQGGKKKIQRSGGWWAFGHAHRNGLYQQTMWDGTTYSAIEIGCMCELNPAYMPHPNWQHGWGELYLEKGQVQMLNRSWA